MRRHLVSSLGLIVILALLALLIYLRTQVVEAKIGTYIACTDCFDLAVVKADLVMVSLAAGVLLLAGLPRPDWPGRLLQAGLGLVLLIHLADVVVFRLFNSRLFLSDAQLFIKDYAAVWDQFSSGMGGTWPTLGILLCVLLVFTGLVLLRPMRTRGQRLALLVILLLSLSAPVVLPTETYVNDWAVTNVFAANLATTERQRYSDAAADELRTAAARQQTMTTTTSQPGAGGRNVIVIMLESWSLWHSALFGGSSNWTPQLDDAALGGLRFTNFHSIGFSTDKGLVGILAGQPLWAPFLHWFETPPFHSMWGIERTLPSVFSDQGYHTAFLTTGPLDIYQKGLWLQDLGFDYVEGNEHPFYQDQPRYAFGAASDQALYQRAAAWLEQATAPYLLVLETVTTHQPYMDPDSGQRSLQLAMQYADREFGAFLRQLRHSGYFDTGVLLVLSDHRSMTPIPPDERERFGDNVHSQIPAFIIGEGFTAGSSNGHVHSQADLVPSFDAWLNGSAELAPLQANMFAPAPAPNCAFHSRGDRRGLVEVICSHGRGQVVLEGDATRFVRHQQLGSDDRQAILNRLGVLRLEGLARHAEYQQREAAEPGNQPATGQ